MPVEAPSRPSHHEVIEGQVLQVADLPPQTESSSRPEAHNPDVEADTNAAREATEARQTIHAIYDVTSPDGKPEAPREPRPGVFVPNRLGRAAINIADSYQIRKELRDFAPPNRFKRFIGNVRREVGYGGWRGGVEYISDRIHDAWDNVRYGRMR